MLWSITSMTHQFYIEHRFINISSMFSMFFHIEANDDPSTKHQRFIEETSMNHQWNKNESQLEKPLTCFTAEFKATKLRTFHIKPSFPITLSKNICQKIDLNGKRTIIRTLTEKTSAGVLRTEIDVSRGSFWANFLNLKNHKQLFFGLPTKNFTLVFSKLISTCLKEQFGWIFLKKNSKIYNFFGLWTKSFLACAFKTDFNVSLGVFWLIFFP